MLEKLKYTQWNVLFWPTIQWSEGFESKGAMMNHFLDAHIEFDCIHCMAQFSKEKELIAHLGTEHNIKYECPLCPHVFISTVTAVML